MKIIGLIIAVVLYVVPFVVLTHFVRGKTKQLKKEIEEIKSQNSLFKMDNQQSEINLEKQIEDNRELVEALADSLDKKFEKKRLYHWGFPTGNHEIQVIDLTEAEKKYKELKQEMKELEREEKCNE